MPVIVQRIDLSQIGDRLLRVPEVAAILGVSERQVRRLAVAGVITRVKLGRSTRVRLSDVRRIVEHGAEGWEEAPA